MILVAIVAYTAVEYMYVASIVFVSYNSAEALPEPPEILRLDA